MRRHARNSLLEFGSDMLIDTKKRTSRSMKKMRKKIKSML